MTCEETFVSEFVCECTICIRKWAHAYALHRRTLSLSFSINLLFIACSIELVND